jgi:hypothetical protein
MNRTEQNRRILHALVAADPDFTAFQAAFSSVPGAAALHPEILEETLAVLSEDPQQAAVIHALHNQDQTCKRSFVSGTEIATLLAVAFVLRTHIKIERNSAGKWRFLIEHKPADSKVLSALLTKLEQFLGSETGPGPE